MLAVCFSFSLAACAKAEPVETGIGSFDYSQTFMTSMRDDGTDTEKVPAQGHIFFVAYLTPADGNSVTIDQAQAYFLNGTKVVLAEQTYDMDCLAIEKLNATVRYGLVFEVVDAGYTEKDQPKIQLVLPSAPQ